MATSLSVGALPPLINIKDIAALFLLVQYLRGKPMTRQSIAETTSMLRKVPLPISGALRRDTGGYQSDDLDEFLSRCIVGGCIEINDDQTITVLDSGKMMFREMVCNMARADGDTLRKIIELFHIDTVSLLAL